MSFFTRYLVYAFAPESPEEFRLEIGRYDRLTEAVEQAQLWASEPANPELYTGEKLKIAIYQIMEVVKDKPRVWEEETAVACLSR